MDPSTAEVEQVWYPSKDGTKVSMFLIHKKGLAKNGALPTILWGYGGFNISATPAFSATLFQWFDAGGLFAVPNLRGGGEYGERWHEAGMLAHEAEYVRRFHRRRGVADRQRLHDVPRSWPSKADRMAGFSPAPS